jgi:hypothetical protein
MTYRLALIPDALQGRVNSAYRLLVLAGQPVGPAATGVVLQVAGPRVAFSLIGAGLLVMACVATLNKRLRTATAPPSVEAVA